MSEQSQRGAGPPREAGVEGLTPRLLEQFGPDFVGLVDQMGLVKEEHLRELLDARPEEQQQLAMAWMKAAATLEADWDSQSRRQGHAEMDLARYLAIRLPSPRRALEAQRAQQQPAPEPPPAPEPTARERESAQRRIRLEAAIGEARAAIRRVDALDRLVEADRQAIIAELEDLISVISRRLGG